MILVRMMHYFIYEDTLKPSLSMRK